MPADTGRAGEREAMISLIESRGVRSADVLSAMRQIPRELFVPPELADQAYDDAALQIGSGQTISQPYMVAAMTEMLELRSSDCVLEVGTGSGYQTAILACLCAAVFTIERHPSLQQKALETLARLNLPGRVEASCGDGSLGWEAHAPYNAILVTAGGPEVPAALRAQLALGGRLVAPVGDVVDQTLIRLRRSTTGWLREEFFGCRFVKLVGAQGWHE